MDCSHSVALSQHAQEAWKCVANWTEVIPIVLHRLWVKLWVLKRGFDNSKVLKCFDTTLDLKASPDELCNDRWEKFHVLCKQLYLLTLGQLLNKLI